MKNSYTIFPGNKNAWRTSKAHLSLDWLNPKYSLPFASENRLYDKDGIKVYIQEFALSPFKIDLIQVEVSTTTYIPIETHCRWLFMHFIFEGGVLYTREDKTPITNATSGNYFMSYYSPGNYFAKVEKGLHVILVINILPEWIEQYNPKLQNINAFINRFKHGSKPYETMGHFPINKKVQRWLYKVYAFKHDNSGALDGNIRKHMSLLIEHYDETSYNQDADKAYQIKQFIDNNYQNTEVTARFIADSFFLSPQTLLNIFKNRYHHTVQQYLSMLRLEKAIRIMEEENCKISEVYMRAGFSDERTFRYAFKQYKNRKK